MNKIQRHRLYCEESHFTYRKKNEDYGGAYSELRKKFPDTFLIHAYEKLMRIEQLKKSGKAQVNESIEDSLLDLANYCLMELVEMKEQEGNPCENV